MLGHVVLEFVRLGRERRLLKRSERLREYRKDATNFAKEPSEPTSLGQFDDAEGAAMKKRLWTELVSFTAWLPLPVHWSLEDGLGIPEGVVGGLGMLTGWESIKEKWSEALV